MTVTAKSTRVQYTGNGLVATYAYDWKILDQADLVVITTDLLGADTTLVLGVGYTVTGAGNDSGGNVVLTNSLATGHLLTVYMDMDIDQPTDLTNQQSPFLERIESALDRLALVSQQLAEKLGRCIQLKPTSTNSSDDLQELLESVDTNATVAAASAATATTQAGLANTARIAAELAETNAEAAVASVPTFAAFGETLAATTTASNARAALELGTAALVNTGTGVGDVPVLGAGGKLDAGVLPATSGTDPTARDISIFDSVMNQIDLGRASGAIPSGYMHLFLSDELATKTNAYYDAAGDYYTNVSDPATDVAPSATITYAGSIHGGATPAALVDGNNTTMFSLTSAAGNSFIFDFGAGGKNIRSLTYIVNGGSFSQDVKLQYSDDGTTYTDTNVTSAVAAVNPTGVTAAVNDYGVHRYWKIALNGSNFMQATTVNLYERIRGDMTLIPTAITAGAAPGTVDVYMLHKAVDSVTLNTDLKARVSRDNGSTWSGYVTLAEVCQYDANYKLLKGSADLSALASGTSVKWEITTLNTKSQRVRAAAMILNS